MFLSNLNNLFKKGLSGQPLFILFYTCATLEMVNYFMNMVKNLNLEMMPQLLPKNSSI